MSQDKVSVENSPSIQPLEKKVNALDRARLYLRDVRLEMKQVSWPTWQQVRSTTFVVLFFAFAMTAFVKVIDWIVAFFYRLIVMK